MWSEFLTHALSRQGYNVLTHPFSDLATRGTPKSNDFAVGFFLLPGLLTIVVGVGLWFAARHGGRLWKAGSLMVVATGVFLSATGVFRQDPNSMPAGVLHATMAQTCFAIASVTPLVLFLGSTRHTHLGAPRRLWLTAGLAALAIEGVGVAIRPLAHYPDGLFQRPFTLALTVWFVATGVWLLKSWRTPTPALPA